MEKVNPKRGRFYRAAADAVTYGRTAAGTLAAANILLGDRLLPRQLRHRSVGLGISFALLGLSDRLDGWLAHKAAAVGVPITRADKEKDPREDKKFNHRVMGAFIAREAASGIRRREPSRVVFAGMLALNLASTYDRDIRMAESRSNAVKGADTSAIKINKWKTGMQNAGHTLATSPLAESLPGQMAITAVYTTSTIMGEVGFRAADRIHKGADLSSLPDTMLDGDMGGSVLLHRAFPTPTQDPAARRLAL